MTDAIPDDRTLTAYASAVAAGTPTPGGGSVIANVAAMSAGLAEMVCAVTLHRPTNDQVRAELAKAQQTAAELRARLLALAHDDERAYGGYRDAMKLPKATDYERQVREGALQAALVASAAVPIEIAQSCLTLMEALTAVARFGSKHTLADVQTSRRFSAAALHNAIDMVAANTTLMKDRTIATALDEQVKAIGSDAERAETQVVEALRERAS